MILPSQIRYICHNADMMSPKTLLLLSLVFSLGFVVSCENEQPSDDSDCAVGSCDEVPECVQSSGPDYWGCLPQGFVEPIEGESCASYEGFFYCAAQMACACRALHCQFGIWNRWSTDDVSCSIFTCDLSGFDPDSGLVGPCP